MGYSLKTAKTYSVEYGTDVAGSAHQTAINHILYNLCVNIVIDEGEQIDYADRLDIPTEDFNDMVRFVRDHPESELQRIQDEAGVEDQIAKQEFLDCMDTLYKEAAKEDGYIHLFWNNL